MIKNDEKTFLLNIDILKLNCVTYETFIQNFADDFIAQAAKHNNTAFSSISHSEFKQQHECPVAGFSSDGMVYFLKTEAYFYQFGINVLKKTTSISFDDDGLVFSGFQYQPPAIVKHLISMKEHTIRFTKPTIKTAAIPNLQVPATKPKDLAVGNILPDFHKTIPKVKR